GSISKGYDTRDFALVAFGGAGAAFAAEIARELHIPKTIVPRNPGVGAAAGLLSTDIRYEYMVSHWSELRHADLAAVATKYRDMEKQARAELKNDGFVDDDMSVLFQADCRYKGQGYELLVDVPDGFTAGDRNDWCASVAEAFHREHERQYLRRFEDSPVQLVNLRTTGVGRVAKAGDADRTGPPGDVETARLATRECVFPEGDRWQRMQAGVYDRERLVPAAAIAGPAIIEQEDTTTVIPPGFRCTVDSGGNLIIQQG
ncbi:MAG: hydantoinase/oxoprolinase family protein, partial [Methyloligellaceae bacterium]